MKKYKQLDFRKRCQIYGLWKAGYNQTEIAKEKGFGTQIVRSFIEYIFQHFPCQTILIDPASSNKRAIRCYEKAGFKFVKEAFDGVTNCYIMKIRTNK